MAKISLLQPRHTYAPEEGEGHIYSPTALWSAGARLKEAGVDVVQVADANLRPFEPATDIVGVNVVGAPYIPSILELQKTFDPASRLILGGAVIAGFTRQQFQGLFGKNVINGNKPKAIANALGVHSLPDARQTSLISIYNDIPDEDMRKYLEREMSFHLGQGCNQKCNFCAALGTNAPEAYRELDIVERDLRYLAERAIGLGIDQLSFYLTNLDVFQTPGRLRDFAAIVQSVVQSMRTNCPTFQIKMRGLSTVSYFLKTHQYYPQVITQIKDAGLHTVGFGIDGATPEVWKSTHKANTTEKCFDAIRIAREVYDLTPEALMVFGHQMETKASLEAAVDFTLDMHHLYGATPRPHVAKCVPGSADWIAAQKEFIRLLFKNPEYFQALDFTALASSISHPDPDLRAFVNHYYQMIANITGNMTDVIYPIAPEFTPEENERHRRMNIGKYDN